MAFLPQCSSRRQHNVDLTTMTSKTCLAIAAFDTVRNHAGVGHVEADIENDAFAVLAGVVDHDPCVGQRVGQRLLPEHQLLILVSTMKHPAHSISASTTSLCIYVSAGLSQLVAHNCAVKFFSLEDCCRKSKNYRRNVACLGSHFLNDLLATQLKPQWPLAVPIGLKCSKQSRCDAWPVEPQSSRHWASWLLHRPL